MKSFLDIIVISGFVFFMIFLMRGFILQVQDKQDEREKKQKDKDKKKA